MYGDEERAVGRVIARSLGERVEIVDDNSVNAMVDIEITYSCGRRAALEVTIDPTEGDTQLLSEISKRHFGLANVGMVKRIWHLDLSTRSNLLRVEREVPALLAALEARGHPLTTMIRLDQLDDSQPEIDRLGDLGVVSLGSAPAGDDDVPAIRVGPEPSGGPMLRDWTRFSVELERRVFDGRLADVRSKLGRCAHFDERHLFFCTTLATDWGINRWLDDFENRLPEVPPVLPSEIDWLWVWRIECPGRVLAWAPHRGWFDPATSWATA